MNLQIVKNTVMKEHIVQDREHEIRVAHLSREIAIRMGLHDDLIKDVYIAALNHDNGKSYMLSDVLNKPGKLSEEEYELIKYHVIYSTIAAIENDYSKNAIKFILYHHENYDGTGYPCGLKEDRIPIGARIIRVADFFDALTNERIYRTEAFSVSEAIEIMRANRQLLDPDVFKTFVSYVRKDSLGDRFIKKLVPESST